ncbi:hypothetical protein OG948_32695 [Embleya sp. NBC_00888]|uniref:hypothetical protein n=1 Tax=Embleya sp. NBC_00888 TaxID=2975960 RepID=UPI003866B97F|nr:hypothetical protein OG948_32695 [Embleya sp. NBC_00888]
MASVVFVHGTGVREKRYEDLLRGVRARLTDLRPDLDVLPCLWGEAHGARLRHGGASVPERSVRAGEGNIDAEDADVIWARLDADPLAELRALVEYGAGRPAYRPARGFAAERLAARVRTLAERPDVAAAAAVAGVAADLGAGAETVAEALPALVIDSADAVTGPAAVARAVVAATLHHGDARADGCLPMDGLERDALVRAIVGALGGSADPRGVLATAGRPLAASGMWFASWRVRRGRDRIVDGAVPPLGDILRYQVAGDGVRGCVARAVEAARENGPVTLLAHSLGGIACVDWLAAADNAGHGVDLLVTAGTQAPFLYELDALRALRAHEALPAHFPRWLNAYDVRDPLAYVAAPVFGTRAEDREFVTGQPLLRAHSAYWAHAPLYRWLAEEIPR